MLKSMPRLPSRPPLPLASLAAGFGGGRLGFDPADGDALPLDPVKFSDTPEGKAKAEAAAAKSRRKARKGERRARGQPRH
jgi:hypothetical protein